MANRKYIVGNKVYEATTERKVIVGGMVLEETIAAEAVGLTPGSLSMMGVGLQFAALAVLLELIIRIK